MTAETLSLATADRYNSRMQHDVQSTSRMSAPPRPDPPLFARESVDANIDEFGTTADGGADPIVSAKATKTTSMAPPDDVTTFFDAFQRAEGQLDRLSDVDKDRIRTALLPTRYGSPQPSPSMWMQQFHAEPVFGTILMSTVLVAAVYIACRPDGIAGTAHGYRAVRPTANSSSASTTTSRNSVMSMNISRLLRPLNPRH